MTCIAAWRDKEHTVVGADSLWTAGPVKGASKIPKLVRHGRFVIGTAGSMRACQVLLTGTLFNEDISDADLVKHLIRDWVPSVREAMQDRFLTSDKDSYQFEGLIVSRKKIIRLGGDLSITDDPMPFAAGGSGEDVAMGYMARARAERINGRGYSIVKGALESASQFLNNVGPPFHILAVK